MKYAEEMTQFAQQYKPDRFFKGFSDPKIFATIESNLYPDENVTLTFFAASGTIGKDRVWNLGVAITENRLLISYKLDILFSPFIKQNCKTYSLKEINSIATKGCMLELSIRAEGNIVIGNWSPEKRDNLAIKIRKIVDEYESKTERVTISPLSGADEIKKYKELLDAGIITQEEFDAKKKQLLGL